MEKATMRLTLALGALVLVLSASSPARADFTVIRWSTNYCSIWNDENKNLWPTWEKGWIKVSPRYRSREAAWGTLTKHWAKRICL
jgi:hypothetical protein